MRAHLRRDLLGFGAVREYPPGTDGHGDIDSGPVVLGVNITTVLSLWAIGRTTARNAAGGIRSSGLTESV